MKTDQFIYWRSRYKRVWLAIAVIALAVIALGNMADASAPLSQVAPVASSSSNLEDAQDQDGLNALSPGFRSLSMGTLVNMGLVRPQPLAGLPAPAANSNKDNGFTNVSISWGNEVSASGASSQVNPAAVVHPSSPLNALVVGHSLIGSSSDGGVSWQTRAPSNLCTIGVLSAAFLPGSPGQDWAYETCLSMGHGSTVTSARSTDRGASWVDFPSNVDTPAYYNDAVSIWADQNPASPYFGRLYMSGTFLDTAGSGSFNATFNRFSSDNGATWSAPETFDAGALGVNRGDIQYSSMAFGPNGTVYFGWMNVMCCGDPPTFGDFNKYRWAGSTDGGVTFPISGTAGTDTQARSISFNSTSPSGFRWSSQAAIGADPADDYVYMTWLARRVDNSNAGAATYFARSSDGGATWAAPSIIYNDPNPNNTQYMPWITVSADHTIHVTFSSSVNNSSNPLAHFYVQSSDRGSTWSAPFQLSGATYNAAAYHGDRQVSHIGNVANCSNTTVIASWTDNRAGNRTYARMGTFDGCGGTPTPTSTATTPTVTPTPDSCNTPNFGTANNFGVGVFPRSAAVGDVNKDSNPDMVIGTGPYISVLLGNGSGGFGAATNFSAGSDHYSAIVADFNRDGNPDLATASGFNSIANNVSVLLGNGSGSFGTASSFSVGPTPVSVAASDFNRDGNPDLAVANNGSNNVSILLGNGLGGFGTAANFSAGSFPYSVAASDFNRDGNPDLAVANYGISSNNVSVLLGNGSGSFGTAANFSAGSFPYSVAASDFNRDGNPDLAVANNGSNNVSILLGNGLGGFAPPNNFPAGVSPHWVSVGDFNQDSNPDLTVASDASNDVSVLLGNGLGGFSNAVNFGVGADPWSVAVGDFNRDGSPDLAVANNASHNVSVLLNECVLEPTITPTLTPTPTPTATRTPDPCAIIFGPWTPVASYIMTVRSPAVATDGTYLYSIGGTDGFTVRNIVQRYDPASNSWAAMAGLPIALEAARAAYSAVNNKIYVFGGYNSGGNVLNTVYVYDIASDSWSVGSPMPAPRRYPNVAYYSGNQKIYVIGGHSVGAEETQTWEYDPVANSWASRTSIPVPMGSSATSIVGQYIYMMGSEGGGGGTTLHYRYDILSDTWVTRASLPAPIFRAAAGVVGSNNIVLYGGGTNIDAYNTSYVYNILTNSWTPGPNMTTAHAYTGGTAIGNRLFVVGGWNGSGYTNVVETSLVTIPPCTTPTPTLTPTVTLTTIATDTPTITSTPTCSPLRSYRILIAYSDVGQPTTLRTALLAEPGVSAVDLFNARDGTPTLAQLAPYDLVVAFSNSPYQNPVAMGDVLADYADANGIVVGLNSNWNGPPYGLEGRWMTGGYSPFNPGPTIFSNNTANITNPGHPLMEGVSTLTAFYRADLTLAIGAQAVAVWTDTPTPTATSTTSPTFTRTATSIFTPTFGPTATRSATPTPTATATPSPTLTPGPTFTPVPGLPAVAYKTQAGHTAIGINAYLGENPRNFSGDWARVIVNTARWLRPAAPCLPTSTPTLAPTLTRTLTPVATSETTVSPTATACDDCGGLSEWRAVAPYIVPVARSAVTTDGKYVYSIGGEINGSTDPTNLNERYDPATDTWTSLAPLPMAFSRVHAAYAAVTNKIYVFGGMDAFFNSLDTVYIYDIASDTWSTGAPMPASRESANALYYDGNQKIYVIGGSQAFIPQDQTWQYDPVTDTWDTSRANIPDAMTGSAGSIVGQFVYLMGTYGNSGASTLHYRYDIVTNTWSARASLPAATFYGAAGAVDDSIVLFGGFNGSQPPVAYDTSYLYNITTNSWTSEPNMNSPHGYTGGTAVDDLVIAVGGVNQFDQTSDVVETARVCTGPCPTPTVIATITSTSTAYTTSTSTLAPSNTPADTATSTSLPANTSTPTATGTNTLTPPGATRTGTAGLTATATRTAATTGTSTRTVSATRTRTPTRTATATRTVVTCATCTLDVTSMQIACNTNGTIHWTATVINSAACQVVGAYAVPLVVNLSNGSSFIAQLQSGTSTFRPGTNIVQGDLCYQFAPGSASMQSYFILMTNSCLDFASSNTIAPCSVTPTCPLAFPDVQPDHKFYSEIESLAALKIVSGYEDGTFRPDASMTRGLAVKMLVRAFNLPLDNNRSEAHFTDVPQSSPYFAYVEAAYHEGLVSGYTDSTFRPEQASTRGALVKMIVQSAKWQLSRPDKPTFSDVTRDSPFYSYVEAAAAHGILDNVASPGGSFQVEKAATRGETAALIARAMPSPLSNLPKSLEGLLRKLLNNEPQK